MGLEEDIQQEKFKSEHSKLILNLMFTNNWLLTRQLEILKPFELTVSQYNVLRILRGQKGKPATINLIIERMLDRMSNASRIVDRLEAKHLVVRKRCNSDRRAVDVFITEKGMDILEKLDGLINKWEKQFELIESDEAKSMNDLLDKIRTIK